MPSYLFSSELPRNVEAVAGWPRPDGVQVQMVLDLAGDRLIVELETLGVSRVVSLGATPTPAVDVHYMLDAVHRGLEATAVERLASQARPEPAWYREVLARLRRWEHQYQPWVVQAAAQLLRDADAGDMPDCEVTYKLKGVPLLTWRLAGRRLRVEMTGRRTFWYSRSGPGEMDHAGNVEIEAPGQLRALMAWLRTGEGAIPLLVPG